MGDKNRIMKDKYGDREALEITYASFNHHLESLMYDLTWSQYSVGICPSPAMTGGGQFQAFKANVQHRQEQTAKVHIVRKGGGNNSEEEQGQNFRHGAEYWKSVD